MQVLTVNSLTKKYVGQSQYALNDVSLTVNSGECVVLLGKNGAGKSTLISAIRTRIVPDSGSIIVHLDKPTSEPTKVRSTIAYVPQVEDLDISLSVIDNMIYHARYFGFKKVDAVQAARESLQTLGIEDLASNKVRNLSGGQRQRVLWARALTHRPKILILDEPSTGLDLYGKQDTYSLVRKALSLGIGVLLTTHDMVEARDLADRIIILDSGQVVAQGTPDRLGDVLGIGDEVITLGFAPESKHEVNQILIGIRSKEQSISHKLYDDYVEIFADNNNSLFDSDTIMQEFANKISIERFTKRELQLSDVFFEATKS